MGIETKLTVAPITVVFDLYKVSVVDRQVVWHKSSEKANSILSSRPIFSLIQVSLISYPIVMLGSRLGSLLTRSMAYSF